MRHLLLITVVCLSVGPCLPTEPVLEFIKSVARDSNFREVIPGRLYRSGVPSDFQLSQLLSKYKIQSVVDLRTMSSVLKRPLESIVAGRGANYYHNPITTSESPASEKVMSLRSAISRIVPPVLFLCHSGSERSGVASALWLTIREGASSEVAAQQLSLKYGYSEMVTVFREWRKGRPVLARAVVSRPSWADNLPFLTIEPN